jgi:pimeloyl-ACP methyl ester carboxylesterase
MTIDTSQQVLRPHPDLPLSVTRVGAGKPVLVVHGGHGPGNLGAIVDHLAGDSLVIMPTHPGWDGNPRPDWFNGIDDIAVTYLNILEDEDLSDVLVVATSLGGWIASEMAVRDRGHRIGRMVLVDPVGAEIPGHRVQVPEPGDPDLPSDSMMTTLFIYGGRTFTDPKLLRRLARVHIPVLVLWGENDDVITPEYGRVYAAGFGNARFEVIPGVGHMPMRDTPEVVRAHIDAFLAEQ